MSSGKCSLPQSPKIYRERRRYQNLIFFFFFFNRPVILHLTATNTQTTEPVSLRPNTKLVCGHHASGQVSARARLMFETTQRPHRTACTLNNPLTSQDTQGSMHSMLIWFPYHLQRLFYVFSAATIKLAFNNMSIAPISNLPLDKAQLRC